MKMSIAPTATRIHILESVSAVTRFPSFLETNQSQKTKFFRILEQKWQKMVKNSWKWMEVKENG